MPRIRPITDLRNTNEISDLCHAKKEPIFITKKAMQTHSKPSAKLIIRGVDKEKGRIYNKKVSI